MGGPTLGLAQGLPGLELDGGGVGEHACRHRVDVEPREGGEALVLAHLGMGRCGQMWADVGRCGER